MPTPKHAKKRRDPANVHGMLSSQDAGPSGSGIAPQTPALPPPGSHRIGGNGDADAAAICDLSTEDRRLPRVPAGAAAPFGELERSEWGLSKEKKPVARRLADDLESEEGAGEREADDGGCAVNEGNESIRTHFALNDQTEQQTSQQLGGKAANKDPDWTRPYSLPERPEDEAWAPGALVR